MNPKQISFLAAFLAAHVEYAVVGGLAVNAYGDVRATNDLHSFIPPTGENARAAYAALQAVVPPLEGPEPNDLLSNQENLRFGPEQVWRNRFQTEIHGISIPFISKSDLIENKRQTGRLRDLTDIEELSNISDIDPIL